MLTLQCRDLRTMKWSTRMKPKLTPTTDSKPAYPSRREFIRRFGLAAASAALSAVALSCKRQRRLRGTPLPAGIVAAPDGKEFCQETCANEIDAQIKLLGSKDPKIHDQAVTELIKIAKSGDRDPKVAKQKQELVLAKVKVLETAEDARIAVSAKKITQIVERLLKKTLTPAKPIPLEGDPVR